MKPKRAKKIQQAEDIRLFAQRYSRKAYPGKDPNDRPYDRKVESRVKRMKPEVIDEILHGEYEEQD